MSAIFGISYFDDRPLSHFALERMAEALAHRGSDGAGVWRDGPIGLGHRMLRTGPERLNETQPGRDPSGRFVITADARLDNRDELIAALGLSALVSATRSDSELILAAYAHWGEHCPEKLLGDFAFAIWDKRNRSLFCARDHFGVKPFYYHSQRQAFLFASEIKALLALPEIPCELDEVRLGDYLANVFADGESTFYRGILRLPAAHSMTVSRNGVSTRRYWKLDPERDVRLGSNDEYAEAFRELFTEAVRCRVQNSSAVGSMLSGGLDSSSITCVAKGLLPPDAGPLKTFSAIFDAVPECDERKFINPVLAQNGIDPHFIRGNEHGPFRWQKEIDWHQDQPTFGPNFAMVWSIYDSAAKQNVRVLLDGHDGDTTVSYGDRYIHELAGAGRWLKLASELRGLSKHHGGSTWESLRAFWWHYGLDPLFEKHRPLHEVRRIWRGAKRRVAADSVKPARPEGWRLMLNPEFASQINMSERHRAWRQTISRTARTERQAHFRMLSHPMQAFALEVHDSAAAAFGIENRYPFWDKRLVEFCLGMPPEQKLHKGWTRIVLRRAMKGILPAEIQWRAGKMDFTASLAHGLRSFEQDRLDDIIIRNPDIIERYVNIPKLRQAYRRFLYQDSQVGSAEVFAIWKAASLASWLQNAWPPARHPTEREALRDREEVMTM